MQKHTFHARFRFCKKKKHVFQRSRKKTLFFSLFRNFVTPVLVFLFFFILSEALHSLSLTLHGSGFASLWESTKKQKICEMNTPCVFLFSARPTHFVKMFKKKLLYNPPAPSFFYFFCFIFFIFSETQTFCRAFKIFFL